jgi:hypothetical protein
MRFEVSMAVVMKVNGFWDVMSRICYIVTSVSEEPASSVSREEEYWLFCLGDGDNSFLRRVRRVLANSIIQMYCRMTTGFGADRSSLKHRYWGCSWRGFSFKQLTGGNVSALITNWHKARSDLCFSLRITSSSQPMQFLSSFHYLQNITLYSYFAVVPIAILPNLI